MRKVYLLLILVSLTGGISFAQKNGTVKGLVYDTIAKQPVAAATVTILERTASSLGSST